MRAVLSFFELAFGWSCDSLGLDSTGLDSAVAIFRSCVATLADPGDTDSSGPDDQNLVLSPVSEDYTGAVWF